MDYKEEWINGDRYVNGYNVSEAYRMQEEMWAMFDDYSLTLESIEATKINTMVSKQELNKEYTKIASTLLEEKVDSVAFKWDIFRLEYGILLKYLPMDKVKKWYKYSSEGEELDPLYGLMSTKNENKSNNSGGVNESPSKEG